MSTVETNIPHNIQPFLSGTKQLLIDGQWQNAVDSTSFEVINPATTNAIANVAHGKAADIELAIQAARKAFDSGPWSKMGPSQRGKLIWKIGDLIEQHTEELAQLETIDNGKPYAVAKAADIPLAADIFRYMAGWCTKIEGNTIPIDVPYTPATQYHAFTLKEPVGVVGQIIPWNFPLLMAAWKLAPALAAGCTIILKPAEQTPLSALRLGELIQEAGIPDGVVNIVTGFGDAGAALAADDRVDKVAFTGSTEVGKKIVQAAAGNLKKVTLELGGKSPNIILKDADLDSAITGAANAIFFNHGQCCCAGSRLYVASEIFDDVCSGVSEQAKKISLGDGFDETTQMGPLVSKEQFDRVTGFLDRGCNSGAEAVCGGDSPSNLEGYFVNPTLLVNTDESMEVVKEEIFGPVVVAMPFDNSADLIQRANDTTYGLAAGVWSKDITAAHRIAKAVRAGTVWINCYNIFDSALPFGGYKQSGWGREMGHEALNNYLETKSVVVSI